MISPEPGSPQGRKLFLAGPTASTACPGRRPHVPPPLDGEGTRKHPPELLCWSRWSATAGRMAPRGRGSLVGEGQGPGTLCAPRCPFPCLTLGYFQNQQHVALQEAGGEHRGPQAGTTWGLRSALCARGPDGRRQAETSRSLDKRPLRLVRLPRCLPARLPQVRARGPWAWQRGHPRTLARCSPGDTLKVSCGAARAGRSALRELPQTPGTAGHAGS